MNKTLLLTLLIVMMSGCKSTTVAKKTILMPAKSEAMQNAKNIAVISVNRTGGGRHGVEGSMTNKIEAFLTGINVQGKLYFNVVDRATMNKITTEQKVSSHHSFDQATAAKLGRLVGADMLLSASYQIENNDTSYNEEKKVCIKKRKSNGILKKTLGMSSCEEYETSNMYCTKRVVSVALTPKVTDVSTGKIAFAKAYNSDHTSSHCPEEGYGELLPLDVLVRASIDSIFNQMRKDIAPYPVTIDLQLIEEDKAQMPTASKALFDEGLFFAQENLFNRACRKFVQSAAIFNGSPAIMYNLGICQELNGNGEAALGYYDKALSLATNLSNSNKKLVVKAIKRQENLDTVQDTTSDSALDKALDLVQGFGSGLLN